ncbi:MAG: YbgC/FadM family acyl-CoA thioesterase [Alphaproteobacteria bacterium]|nr:YbgC/FadM family acyl-CoA thioesterase [Alphaproteobacteria bacterium]MBE8220021.1 YbgC/FadM family acyl-CoA thioesterase [Alphaproteobacteria bacterium]
MPVRVYYEDTDFSGVVYHANYLRFAERGRSDFLRDMAVHHTDLIARTPPLAFAVHGMDMNFVASAHIDDMLEVRTTYTELRGARLNGFQCILRGDTLIWHSAVRAVIINADTNKPARVPKDIADKITPYLTETLPAVFGF